MIFENVKDFQLDHIFDCGQCFRWQKQEDGSYRGVALGHVVEARLINGCYGSQGAERPRIDAKSQGAERPANLGYIEAAERPRMDAKSQGAERPANLGCIEATERPRMDAKLQGAERPANLGYIEAAESLAPSDGSAMQKNTKSLILTYLDTEKTPDNHRKMWHNYFDLSLDYGSIKESLSKDPVMKNAIEKGQGIRILNQDFWETMVSFIISQNNNIPRIKGCIEKLSQSLGEEIYREKNSKRETKVYYNIPGVEILANASEETLKNCSLGYRGPYLIKVARQVMEKGGIEKVEKELKEIESGEKVIEALKEFCGVGPKVASCISLFGLHRLDAFPIDVWVKRVMNKAYGFSEKDVKGMERFAKENFKDLGGIAQQYLFYYIRETS